MSDPKNPVEPGESVPPPKPAEPKKGGFGAFAEVYRARWAANHPNMRRREPTTATDAAAPESTTKDATPVTPPVADTTGKRPATDEGSRLLHPWERA